MVTAEPILRQKGAASIGRRARHSLFAVAVTGLGSLLLTGAWWLALSPSPLATPHSNGAFVPASATELWTGRPKAPSIVALPFINLSGDTKNDYLADGITDSLTTDLARALPGVLVVSRDTAFTYKGRSADAQQIGRELEVHYLLEGSVLLAGERVRVNTRLIETKDGHQLWAERFDTERTGILQI